MSHDSTKLTSTEIASLWTSYMNDTMVATMLTHMLQYIEDPEIKAGVEHAYNMAVKNIHFLKELFQQEQFATPNGFTEDDVNTSAPRLYSDTFSLTYVNHMAKVGMLAYGGFLSMSVRSDVREFFTNAINETATLYNSTLETAVSKGFFVRAPYIGVPEETDYVDTKKYLSGLNPFTGKRPLNAIEISHLYMNIQTNSIGAKLCLSFGQTSQSKEIQEYMLRGSEISKKHVKLFTEALAESDLIAPGSPDVCVSYSTTQTYSDKIMMFHMSLLSAAGTGNYATAAAASQRTDLAVNYERLSAEIAQFAKSGADIMIKNNWLEQPPGLKDREKLVKKEGMS
ncbi:MULTISPECIES: DUF3231 family protein [Bacillaceae]|uniref:DUF3231 family protein n=1 Tax=Bacillaceae TaxID=186817 RepID=UPI000BFDF6A9|nr:MULTISPECIES: DUF3231 family protein [Bacillaceae]PGT79135.1 hypothetical protein COD11_22890 [Bacillus sp. AFS040349]UGB31850.1 DUF3231 family protein [Metabacillus sp. B2-18]